MSTTVEDTNVDRLYRFLVHEAALLDDGYYQDWLALLHDDFLYRVPVPVSREDVTLSHHDDRLEFANESKSFLAMRFSRVEHDYAWSERPAAFTRHFVTNLRVLDTSDFATGRWDVATNVLLSRARLPDSPVFSSAERRDTILEEEGELLLRSRTVYLDTEIPNESQLGVIY